MFITPINSINNSQSIPTFKSIRPTAVNKRIAEKILETTLTTAAIYGIYQVKKVEEKMPFIETKTDENIVSIKLDSNGNEEFRTIIKPSNIAGEYNISQCYPNGDTKILSSVNYDNNDKSFNIQKNFVSPRGIQTQYKRSGTDDDYQMTYVIKDKNGKVKLDFRRSFKKLDNETTETTVNGKKHINSFGILGVESINQSNPSDKNFMIINWRFEDNMKKLPAEFFYCMRHNNIRLIEDNYKNENNACVSGNIIQLSTNLRNDYFVFAHEVGHIKSDELGDLTNDKDLQEIFEEEKANAIKNMGKVLQKEAEYFLINPFGLDEVIAETYAILSGLDHNNIEANLSMRTNILMQFFPNTITYIANKIYN